MNFGYIKIATFTPKLRVCDVEFNVSEIIKAIRLADDNGVQLLTFPELSITGVTAGDLFLSDTLLKSAKQGLMEIAKSTIDFKMLIFVGLPLKVDGRIYNVASAICKGEILAFIPKTNIKSDLFAELGNNKLLVDIDGKSIPFANNIILADTEIENFKVGAEIGEDLDLVISPSTNLALGGARIIVNLAGEPDYAGKDAKRSKLIESVSERLKCAYAYSLAGAGESTTDNVYSGQSYIAEKGEMLKKSSPFTNELNVALVDLDYIDFSRAKEFDSVCESDCFTISFNACRGEFSVDRAYENAPFIFKGEENATLLMQAEGLKKRIEHTNAKSIVIGLSGGLDSTLAILVCALTVDRLKRDRKDILAVTMPCFGTTSRTLDNSVKLAHALGVTLKKIDISKAVTRHLKDIDHDFVTFDPAYENAQARERTQVLMDLANMYNGLVVGTGDLSEIALGWATYNGDQMSMYGVNSSIPKTLVRHLVEHCKNNSKGKIKAVLTDVLDTPVSPELLPTNNEDTILQKTEDIVGPYDLHDFFLYYFITRGFTPSKIFRVAVNSFKVQFDEKTILKWLKIFFRRYFNQQFKRSCMPDGVKATEISLSPRGELKMPSDAVSKLWTRELDEIQV